MLGSADGSGRSRQRTGHPIAGTNTATTTLKRKIPVKFSGRCCSQTPPADRLRFAGGFSFLVRLNLRKLQYPPAARFQPPRSGKYHF